MSLAALTDNDMSGDKQEELAYSAYIREAVSQLMENESFAALTDNDMSGDKQEELAYSACI